MPEAKVADVTTTRTDIADLDVFQRVTTQCFMPVVFNDASNTCFCKEHHNYLAAAGGQGQGRITGMVQRVRVRVLGINLKTQSRPFLCLKRVDILFQILLTSRVFV